MSLDSNTKGERILYMIMPKKYVVADTITNMFGLSYGNNGSFRKRFFKNIVV
jgi:hypothetical protein